MAPLMVAFAPAAKIEAKVDERHADHAAPQR
jgi:hypothetical protein